MKAEDVPQEWVERAAREIARHRVGSDCWDTTSAWAKTWCLNDARHALAAVIPLVQAAERERLLNKIEGECEAGKSRADLYRKRASEDAHQSEEQHQEGRWHAHHDMAEFLTSLRARNPARKAEA